MAALMAMRPLHAAAFSSLAPARRSAKPAPSFHRTFLVPSASIPCWPEVDIERLAGAPRLDTLCRCIAATFHLGASSEPRSDSSFLAAFAKPSWTSRLGFGLLDSLDGRPPPGARPIGAVQVSGQHLRVTGPSEWLSRQKGTSTQKVWSSNYSYSYSYSYCRCLRVFTATAESRSGPQAALGRRRGARLELLGGGDNECSLKLPLKEESLRSLLHRVLEARGRSRLLVLREDAPADASEELTFVRGFRHLALAAADEGLEHLVVVVGDHIGLRPVAMGRLVSDFGASAISLGPTPLLTSQCISILQYLLDSGMAQVISHGAFLLSYGVFY
eukprot:s1711_g2.t2